MFRIVFYLLLVILLGRYFQCDLSKSIYNVIVGPTICEKTLYLDTSLDEYDIFVVRSAAEEWEDVTEGKAKFKIKENFKLDDISNIKYDKDNVIVIVVGEDSPIIKKYDMGRDSGIVGYFATEYSVPMIILVRSRMESLNYYRAVTMHEMGHALGLRHSSKEGTIMYPIANYASSYLTEDDLMDFCRNYRCE